MAIESFPIFRFSTEAFPEPQRADVLREMYAQQLTRFDFEALPDHPLNVSFAARPLGQVVVTSGAAAGVRAQHTRVMPGQESDSLFLGLTLRGKNEARQGGRTAEASDGDAVLLTTADPLAVKTVGDVEYLGLQLSRAVLAPLVAGIDDAIMKPIPRSLAALKLFTIYAQSLLSDELVLDSGAAHIAAMHLCDLAALAIGARREAAEIAEGRGVRAARLQAVKQDIAANLNGPGLSLDRVALRQGISPSYVRKLFESEQTSFSDYVLSQRLLRADRALRDPAQWLRPIATIAFDAGFGDLSYFNRVFRRRYGMTPSELRASLRKS